MIGWLKPLFLFLLEIARLIPQVRAWGKESAAAGGLDVKRQRNRDAVYGVPGSSDGQRSAADSASTISGSANGSAGMDAGRAGHDSGTGS